MTVPGRNVGRLLPHHRLVELRVEGRPERRDLGHAVLPEDLGELAGDHLDPRPEVLRARRRSVGEGPFEVVEDADEVAHRLGERVLDVVGLVALRAPLEVLEVGRLAQERLPEPPGLFLGEERALLLLLQAPRGGGRARRPPARDAAGSGRDRPDAVRGRPVALLDRGDGPLGRLEGARHVLRAPVLVQVDDLVFRRDRASVVFGHHTPSDRRIVT